MLLVLRGVRVGLKCLLNGVAKRRKLPDLTLAPPLRGFDGIVGVPLEEGFELIGPGRDGLEPGGLVVVDRLESLANHAQFVQHLGEHILAGPMAVEERTATGGTAPGTRDSTGVKNIGKFLCEPGALGR